MKYLKTYEITSGEVDKFLLDKIDLNKIYIFADPEGYQYGFDFSKTAIIIGRLEKRNHDLYIRGYLMNNNESKGKIANTYVFKKQYLREATPEEIEQYEMFKNVNNYNL